MDIGIAGVLNFSELKGLANALDAFFDNPDSEANVQNLFYFLMESGLDPFSLDVFGLTANIFPSFNPPLFGSWVDMERDDFGVFTDAMKTHLLGQYPSQAGKIFGWWPCWVLGPSQEEAALESLGLPFNNNLPAGFNRIPDGYSTRPVYDDNILYPQSLFIEVKGRYSGNTFDYSSQSGQFSDYRAYLRSPFNTHEPHCTIIHGLYMILPTDVTLTSNVVNSCSLDNIPLYQSGLQYNVDNNSEVRVKRPELKNISQLDYSCHLFDWLGDRFFKSSLEEFMYVIQFDHDGAIIPFQWYADRFETSILEPNGDPSNLPDGEECEDN